MRPFTKFNILLLTSYYSYWGHAFLTLGYYYNNIPRQIPGCHYPTLGSETYIHFYATQDKTMVYAISTPWRDTYDNILRKALPAHGFVLLGTPSVNSSETCHWKDLDKIWVAGVHRGDISYKEISTSAILGYHMPRYEPRRPPTDTLIKIRSILLSNAPAYDLLMLVLICTLPFTGIALLLGPLWYIARQREKLSNAKDMDVELLSINAPSTSGQSTLDLELPEKLEMKDDGPWSPSYPIANDPRSFKAPQNQLDVQDSEPTNALRN
jgi:hypothetical protein